MENKINHWIRLSELKKYYIASLDNSVEFKFMFGEEFYEKHYKQEKPSLKGLIKFVRNYKISGFKTAIIGKNNNIIKIA